MHETTEKNLRDIVNYARQHSPFYARAWAGLAKDTWSFQDLPLTDMRAYMEDANSIESWPVLTGRVDDAIVFRTGGTTGGGKISVFTRKEWADFTASFSRGMQTHLEPGDRIGNMFVAGDLCASFLFIHDAINASTVPVVEFPFTAQVGYESLCASLRMHRINVLVGVPAQLLRVAGTIQSTGESFPQVRCILYGGESLYGEQRALLRQAFPLARIASIGCASVDAGLIGASTPQRSGDEHEVFSDDTLVEILDEESGQPITEPGRSGILIVTNLHRRLMPIIRYSTGDLACWAPSSSAAVPVFSLCGRAHSGYRVRIGTLSLFPDSVAPLMDGLGGVIGWQWVVDRNCEGHDRLTLRIADAGQVAVPAEVIRERVLENQPSLAAYCASGQLELCVELVQGEQLITHPRSGKAMRVVDSRRAQ